MYYRRRILLALLQEFGGRLSATDFQKLLFLFCRSQSSPAFDFVPYLYSCYSFQSFSDKQVLAKAGLIKDSEEWSIEKSADDMQSLTDDDQSVLAAVGEKYRTMRGDALIKHVYTSFPYFAINSTIAGKLLTSSELLRVEAQKPSTRSAELFSIGYEGRSG